MAVRHPGLPCVSRRAARAARRVATALCLVLGGGPAAATAQIATAAAAAAAQTTAGVPAPASATAPGVPIDDPPPPIPPAVVTRDGGGRATVRAIRLTTGLSVDGRLDEPVYRDVPPVSDFIQQLPDEGAPATERTDAWVMFDEENFYVAGRCWDSAPPSAWAATDMQRDSRNMLNNDLFGFLIDTFYDRRNALLFYANPLGGFVDQQITNEGNPNRDWNPVWDVRTDRFDGGWTIEMVVPFKSLRYRPTREQVWGIQLRRTVIRKNEWAYLTLIPISAAGFGGRGGVFRVSAAGTLVGLEAPPAGRPLEIKPYAIGGVATDLTARPPERREGDGAFGVDLKYGITENLTADFTYNTDFAQVEVDEQQVNLTRFNLFFPEKREFFLEGRGIFSFARGSFRTARSLRQESVLGGGDAPTLFYSRRIGLRGSQVVPILGGGRVTGKVGPFDVGALAIRTDDETGTTADDTAFTVLRVKRDLLRRSSVGAIVTHRTRSLDGAGTNAAFGADARLLVLDELRAHPQLAEVAVHPVDLPSALPVRAGPADTEQVDHERPVHEYGRPSHPYPVLVVVGRRVRHLHPRAGREALQLAADPVLGHLVHHHGVVTDRLPEPVVRLGQAVVADAQVRGLHPPVGIEHEVQLVQVPVAAAVRPVLQQELHLLRVAARRAGAQDRVPAGGKVDALPDRRTLRGLPERRQPERRHVPAAQPARPLVTFGHAPGDQQRPHLLVPRARVVHLRQRAEHFLQGPAEVVVPDRRVGAVGEAEPDRRREQPAQPRVAVQVDPRMPRRLRQAQHVADRADGVADRPFPEQSVRAHGPLQEGVEAQRPVDREVHDLLVAQREAEHADGGRAQRLPVRRQRFVDVGVHGGDQPRRRVQQVLLHVAAPLSAERPGVEDQVVGRRHVQREEAVLQRLRADLRELLDRVGVVPVAYSQRIAAAASAYFTSPPTAYRSARSSAAPAIFACW